MRARRSFEAVEDDDERGAAVAAGQPVEVNEITVWRFHPLATQRGLPATSEQRAPESLEMAAPIPPGRAVVGARGHSITAGAQIWPPHSPSLAPACPRRAPPPCSARQCRSATSLLLALEKQLDDFRRDLARPLVQLGLGQVRDRVREREELV